MRLRHFFFLLMVLGGMACRAQVTFGGNAKPVFEETPAKSTGLGKIYVLYNTAGVGMSYTAQSPSSTVVWSTYGDRGAAYAQEITSGITRNGAQLTLAQVMPNTGYVIEEGTKRTYVWIVNYADYRLNIQNIATEPASDCGTATLNVQGTGTDMAFFTITGVRQLLDRGIKLHYYTLSWNDSQQQWGQTEVNENQETFKSTIVVSAPLCNTAFRLSGDRFLQYWGEGVEIESDSYTTNAVDVHTSAVQEKRNNNNEKGSGGEGTLGGSAPAHITFTAHVTDAAIHKEWQMATDAEFQNVELRLNNDVVDQTFEQAGTFYWRFIGSNASGTCEAVSETYTVNIGESELVCPNVFTPGTTEGVNDEWKVSYKSIVEFKCWIYNSWGNLIVELNDPSQGWDGKYKGKLVDSGVYYYVLRAKGSDGKKYDLSGDINIIGYKKNPNGTGTTPTGQ